MPVLLRVGSVLFAAVVASHVGACAPAPSGPRLDTHRAEVAVREAFADSLIVLRTGTRQQVLATVADDFVMKTDGTVLGRDAAVRHLPVDRQILKLDKVTPDSAVVTSDDPNRRYVEVWVRTADGWKLARVDELQPYSHS